jgi:hypothetical protein
MAYPNGCQTKYAADSKELLVPRPNWCTQLGFSNMAMLTHDLERPLHPSEAKQRVRSATARPYLAMIKRLCLGALTVLLAGGALAAVIALKTAIFFWRFKLGAG